MGQVKRKIDAHRRQPDEPILLSGDELSFVVADVLGHPVFVELVDGVLQAEAAMDGGGRCWLVRFRGEVVVDGGHLDVWPEHLQVGAFGLPEWAVGPLVGWLTPSLDEPPWSEHDETVRGFRVVDDHVSLSVSGL